MPLAIATTFLILALAGAQDTCTVNNQIFRRGESFGDAFATRCGSAQDFPCYCNPDLSPPIECNYCSFALESGGLLCARDEEIVSFTDIRGDDKLCSCIAVSGSPPSANCDITVEEEEFCSLDLPDGTTKLFNEGEVIENISMPNNIMRCVGEEFPCFCINGQIECPYCQVQKLGGDYICAEHDESFSFQDMNSIYQTCSCEIGNDGQASTECISTTGEPTLAPTTTTPKNDGCEVYDSASASFITIADGDIFNIPSIEGVCGNYIDWPVYCKTGSSISRTTNMDNVNYPYCIIGIALSGDTVCAKHKENVVFVDDTGVKVECNCVVNKVGGTTSNCKPTAVTTNPSSPNSSSPHARFHSFFPMLLGVVLASIYAN